MASKKVPMTEEIKLKLKRDIPSLFEPKTITIESDSEPDHIFKVKLMNNLEFFGYGKELNKCNTSDTMDFYMNYLELGIKYIVPKIVEWTNEETDYTDMIEEYIPFVKPEILIKLFEKYSEMMA